VADSVFLFLAQHATRFMALGLLLGIAIPPLAGQLRPMLPMVVWVVLYLSMLRIDWVDIIAWRQRPMILVATIIFILLISPLLMWGLLQLIETGAAFPTGLVLMAASAPYTAVAAMAIVLQLDAALALVILVSTTILMPFVLPWLVVDVLNYNVALDALTLMRRLGMVVGIAVSLAVVSRYLIGGARLARNAHRVDGISVLMILAFAVALMDGVTAAFIQQPGHVLTIVGAAFAANAGLQFIGALAFWRLGPKLALTIGYAAGNGNLAIILAVLPADVHPDIPLYFSLGQFPMFIFPLLSRPLFRYLQKRPQA
jgi:bile acid:Na+ symporter, BASS family